jgi:hypothetical protein
MHSTPVKPAPQSQATQTTSPSTPASGSPQRPCSVKKASSSVSRLTAMSLPRRAGLVLALVLLGLLRRDRPAAAEAARGQRHWQYIVVPMLVHAGLG